MSSLLSAITGQLTKAIVLGALLPAALFVFLYLVFVAPLLPPSFALEGPQWFGAEWNVLSVTFATLVLTGLLFSLDTPLIRLYEGYPWKDSLLGAFLTGVQRRRMERLRQRRTLLLEVGLNVDDEAWDARFSLPWADTGRALLAEFPDRPELVLPTRLGNILRAFERYPSVQYRMDAIYLWPRLIAVIPDRYAAALGDARTTLAFLVTLSALTAVLGVMTIAAGLTYVPSRPLVQVALPAAGFFAASGALYAATFGAAQEWGQLVRGAFDLYRWDLLRALGHRQEPRTRSKERALWERITAQIMFGDEPVGRDRSRPRIDYEDPPAETTQVQSASRGVEIDVTRAVEGAGAGGELRIVVTVENLDRSGRTAGQVVITERLPAGWMYRWGSARVDDHGVPVTGTGPYRFAVGDLPSGASAVLAYTACAIHPGRRR